MSSGPLTSRLQHVQLRHAAHRARHHRQATGHRLQRNDAKGFIPGCADNAIGAAQALDLEFMQWLSENGIPFCIIFTKADKLKPNALIRNIESYKTTMLEIWEEMPVYFVTSSETGLGRDEVLDYIENLNNQLVE